MDDAQDGAIDATQLDVAEATEALRRIFKAKKRRVAATEDAEELSWSFYERFGDVLERRHVVVDVGGGERWLASILAKPYTRKGVRRDHVQFRRIDGDLSGAPGDEGTDETDASA